MTHIHVAMFAANSRLCCRCDTRFDVLPTKDYAKKEQCVYHWGKCLKRRGIVISTWLFQLLSKKVVCHSLYMFPHISIGKSEISSVSLLFQAS